MQIPVRDHFWDFSILYENRQSKMLSDIFSYTIEGGPCQPYDNDRSYGLHIHTGISVYIYTQ